MRRMISALLHGNPSTLQTVYASVINMYTCVYEYNAVSPRSPCKSSQQQVVPHGISIYVTVHVGNFENKSESFKLKEHYQKS